MLTPVDLETTVFRRGFRGYKTSEVQEFMEQVTTDFERLYKENKLLKDEKERLEEQIVRYRQVEETLRNTLVLAQQTAEEVKNAGQKQADLILREAQHRSDQIKGRVREEIQGELQKLANIRQQVDLFRYQFKKFLEGIAEAVDKHGDTQEFWDKLQTYGEAADKELVPNTNKPAAQIPADAPEPVPATEKENIAEETMERLGKTSFGDNEFFKETGS